MIWVLIESGLGDRHLPSIFMVNMQTAFQEIFSTVVRKKFFHEEHASYVEGSPRNVIGLPEQQCAQARRVNPPFSVAVVNEW